MRTVLIFLFVFFCSITLKSNAATFTVTSNADAGPGTLREALTLAAANGTTVKDYIYFNLPDVSEAGRTIILKSELPKVSSNIVIDGSTQTGLPFKMSDAKVFITADWYSYIVSLYDTGALMIIGSKNVEVYGLYIYGFRNLKNNYPSSGSIFNAGILIHNSQYVTIGSPGKGNIFSNNQYGIQSTYTNYTTNDKPSDVTIQSNFFGFANPDGSYFVDGAYLEGKNLIFGGDTPEKGNYVLSFLSVTGENAIISNNYFALYKDKSPIAEKPGWGTLYPILASGSNNITISKNISSLVAIRLSSATNFKFISNTTTPGGQMSLDLENCVNGQIGTDDINLKNVFGIGNITSEKSNNIEFRKNSIICSYDLYRIFHPLSPPPVIDVLVSNNSEFSGTATPNSTIYVYNDNTDCDVCNPVDYYTTVTASAGGQWKITGDFTNKKLIANTTSDKKSSQYTTPYIVNDPTNVISPTCGLNNGSIKITTTRQVLKIEWYNAATNQKIGEGAQINNLAPGTYYALGSNGRCSAKTNNISIYDYTPIVDDSQIDKKNPSCGQKGSIQQLYLTRYPDYEIKYTWTDKNNNIVGNALNIYNLDAGEYTLHVNLKDRDCETSYGPVILKNEGGPTINQTAAAITSTNCNTSLGSVKGIIVTGVNPKFSWKNDQQWEVSTTLDLINQPAGTYTLTVTDETNCGSVSTEAIEIPETNGITINASQKIITRATCQFDNGSITGVQATGATKYEWYDTNGFVVSNTRDLTNAATGDYYLLASNDAGCSKQSETFTITREPPVDYGGTTKVLVNATCNENNGSIEIIFQNPTGPLPSSYKWVNTLTGQTFITTGRKLTDIDAGSYAIYGLVDGCEQYIYTYAIGRTPAVAVNIANLQVIDYSCASGGSITGIQLSLPAGQYKAQWLNQSDQPICDCVDFLNANPGKYRFKVSNADGSCPQLFGPYEIKAINAVSLVTTNVDVRSQTACELGQITGLTSPDATSFSWRKKNSTDIISTSIDLLGVPAGDYELTISNANCSRPVPFTIAFLPPVNFSAFPTTVTASCHAFGTGTITINTNSAPSQPIEYRWMNSNNERVGYDKTVQYLPAGTYKLWVRDNTGCESNVQQVIVGEVPEMITVFGNYHDIYCGVGKGSIDASTVTGGKGNYIYTWTDASGTIIAPVTQKSLSNLSAGSYKLVITDFDPQRSSDFSCNRAEITYTIKESDLPVPPPIVNNKEVNRKGNTTLAVQDAYPTAIYRLYDSETSNTPIDEAQGGSFTINVTETKTYWVELTYGTCPSVRSKVTVVLGLIADAIPNAFSPNGDGVNDYWVIKGIEESTLSNVKIFNRAGQMVFQSRGYAKPFDGTYTGKQLPAGVYYYIIERQNDKPLSGHVTIIR